MRVGALENQNHKTANGVYHKPAQKNITLILACFLFCACEWRIINDSDYIYTYTPRPAAQLTSLVYIEGTVDETIEIQTIPVRLVNAIVPKNGLDMDATSWVLRNRMDGLTYTAKAVGGSDTINFMVSGTPTHTILLSGGTGITIPRNTLIGVNGGTIAQPIDVNGTLIYTLMGPALTGTVRISGISGNAPKTGDTLTVDTSEIDNQNGTPNYRWYARRPDGKIYLVGSFMDYIVQENDIGYTILLSISYSKCLGSLLSEETTEVIP